MRRKFLVFFLLLNLLFVSAQDTLKVMQYNLLFFGSFTNFCTLSNNDPDDKVDWLKEIIDYTSPDIFSVNEISPNTYYHQLLLDGALNASGRNYYEKATTTNNNNSQLVNMLYYNSEKLGLASQDVIITTVRDINVYKLYHKQDSQKTNREDVFLYCIVAHLKAGSDASDKASRAEMTADVMDYIISHQITDPILFMGDFNLQNSSEQAWVNLTQGQQSAYNFTDPAGRVGSWHNNSAFKDVHSQSTHTNTNGCAAAGGMDDRFDFILANQALSDAESVITLINNSYETLGQDGQRFNGSLIDPPNSSAPSNVINALYNMSDHLPLTIKLRVGVEEPTPGCADLFFSEYVEGSGNNKALEIFNPSNFTIDLSNYRIARYGNGSFNPDVVSLDGTLDSKDTYVVVLDKRDPNGIGYETPVDLALMAVADTFLCPVYDVNKTMYFNGDDAMALEKSNGDLVDLIGKIGEDPGTGWTDDADCATAPFTDACGAEAWTKDHTLVRKYDIESGAGYNPQYFDVSMQWDLLPIDTFDSLGFHNSACGSVLPPHWSFTPTNSFHSFSIPLSANPVFNGLPLPVGSYIGAFYLDGQIEKCGGYKMWDGISSNSVPAYGDDFLTPEKDGFDHGENIIWKVFLPDPNEEYYALAEYNQALAHHDGKFYSFGISVLTAFDAYETEQQTLSIGTGWSAVSSYLQPKWKNIESVFGDDFQQVIYLGDGVKSYYPGESIFELVDIEMSTAYLVKSQAAFDLELEGVSDHQQSLQLYAGWNLLPVLSTCPLTPFDILFALDDALVQIKEIAGNKVYWPEKQIGTLETILPGSAYYILLNEDAVLYFEDCGKK